MRGIIEEMENQQEKTGTGTSFMNINCNKDCKPVYFT